MPLSDKNRKILWARSGNRCALCRAVLVIDKTANDDESIIGEECHIVSAASNGPRFDAKFPTESIDAVENLILLCASHHKMIDDQFETYTASVVQSIKQGHEKWVDEKLQDKPIPEPVRIQRIKENIPKQLIRVKSGKELFAMISNSFGSYSDHESDMTDDEVELVGGFIQELSDWRNLSRDLEPIESIRTTKRLQDLIHELEANGFYVFGAIEVQRIEGGIKEPSSWPMLHLSVLRSTNPKIKNTSGPKQSDASGAPERQTKGVEP